MKTTISAIAVAVALIAGVGAASAMPTAEPFDYETVFSTDNG